MSEKEAAGGESAHSPDLERADHATQGNDPQESPVESAGKTANSGDEILSGDAKDEPLSRLSTTADVDEDDPFALYPNLSITMSSTRGPGIRRNTAISMGRPLTRESTIQTLKSVRSRVAEARDEFDENVHLRSIDCLISRTIFQNLLPLMRISSHLMGR